MGAGRGGALSITHSLFEANIYLGNGQIVHAEAGPLKGFGALEILAGLHNAPFRFDAEKDTSEHTIEHSLETHHRLSELFLSWQRLSLPQDWAMTLRIRSKSAQTQLSTKEITLLSMAAGKTIAEVLMAAISPLEAARGLYRLIQEGLIEVQAVVNVQPEQLAVLSLYGSGQGVAVLDQELYDAWHNQLGSKFFVRVQVRGKEVIFQAEPRANLIGRLGLFEHDMRQLKLARGNIVEVRPESQQVIQ